MKYIDIRLILQLSVFVCDFFGRSDITSSMSQKGVLNNLPQLSPHFSLNISYMGKELFSDCNHHRLTIIHFHIFCLFCLWFSNDVLFTTTFLASLFSFFLFDNKI